MPLTVSSSISISDPEAELTYQTFTRTCLGTQLELPIPVGAGTPGFSNDTVLIEIVSMIVYNPNNIPATFELAFNSSTTHIFHSIGPGENVAIIKQSQPMYTTVQELRCRARTTLDGTFSALPNPVHVTISYKKYEV